MLIHEMMYSISTCRGMLLIEDVMLNVALFAILYPRVAFSLFLVG